MLQGEREKMAAQKLTKGRLAQIIIMLCILIIAFTWRTATYNKEQNVTCNPKVACSIRMNNSDIVVTNNATDTTLNLPENLIINVDILEGEGVIVQDRNRLTIMRQNEKMKLKITDNKEIVYLTLLN